MAWLFSRSYPERKAVDVDGKTFDYVIVGGGTAACALASRLSEDPSTSVLVVCKGKVKDNWLDRIPIVGNASDGKGPQIETFWSEPDERWTGCKTRTFNTQALGGATRVNGLMLTRGAPGNYNQWAALGNDEWSWDKCEPYFKKIENAACHPDAPYRGHEGPLYLRQNPLNFPIDQYIQKAAGDMNLPVQNDGNNPNAPAMGLFTTDIMIDKFGYRHSSLAAYLPKSTVDERRERLTLCTGVVATKLQTNDDGTEVTGVHILDHLDKSPARQCFVKAEREVIVCCGTHFSPQLLMLRYRFSETLQHVRSSLTLRSGIGPKKHLEKHNIPLVRDMPGVGADLQDHITFGIAFRTRLIDSYLRLFSPLIGIWHFVLFLFFKTGLLATSGTRLCAWFHTSTVDETTMTVRHHGNGIDEKHDNTDALRPENVPDIELLFTNASYDYEKGKGYCAFQTTLVQPFSRGRIELASSDPLAHPKVFHHYITDPRDWAAARKAARFSMSFVERFRQTQYPFNATWHLAPGVKAGTVEGGWRDVTDEQIDAYIRERLVNIYHATSTCRMGTVVDKGVVGQNLKVHGFRNLRVADASVFPKVTSAHTVAPTYMVAERCADFIKRDWAERA
ncbi:choline dehydrogenase [Colletotrichum paranaense]|uniref:Choline dehydrogenase n=1 Tax=Colletotrichum paranaense TaxID=1914294 RepID=A0ABQ9SLL3_9PEZI|nr:choline dehydrogenase [Colletotrichum paranaense]KAK1540323.1 choline dehydrogenase [Colletotrichum paranaense]